ncbi:ABC transporter substrate-binding protein [Actibacterium sp. 188UL27-1]|uniref:ABC transporter substrate-binding protein n=1 Tax=Actibacterium sp. 188UL27-1 TaxID=2786961 RepID=UPI001EF66845|nr:extracellular solute-binding protein [Actibacterium sp. 188UL27-1]
MKHFRDVAAGLLLSTALVSVAKADTIRFWTMEIQPERMAVQEKMVADFEAKSGHTVELIPIEEADIQTRATAAFAAGDLPDVLNHTVQHLLPYAEAGLLDTAAATEVVENLGVGSFASGPVEMAMSDGEIVSVPSDGWTQMVVYRADLFEEKGLAPPDSYGAITAAIDALHNPPEIYGFVAATKIDEGYMMQLIEHLSLATGYSPITDDGAVNEDTTQLVELLELYKKLVDASPQGDLYWSQSRELYLDGKAAMVIWSPSILDELGGLRDSAPVTISDDPTTKELAEATGFVTVLKGPGNADGAAWADVRYLGITADANTAVAQEFVEFVVSEGYGDWLSQAPEGKFPVRRGAEEGDTSYEEMWATLEVGVDRKAPLGDIYPKQVIDDIVAGLAVGDRWGAASGQLATASKLVNARVMSRVIREMTDGELGVQEAADKIVAEHKALGL